ncbi:MAG: helix-turn-helix transcriptional regulator [Clostridium sp.]|uniref:HTH cro/C1-type domain-containing protein n=1 Tax=uncultured prokaryote TaxID=198431 RepID=A0A0H5PYJ4_9ZZZZ|nr:helix-turn-helix transcriptional regulator [Clostridium sp.]CRY94265.1 hypothetical protein [uncultured prokaryote]
MGVGVRIKTILREKKMTIKELSQKTGISLNTLYSITKRDSNRADAVILQRIANTVELPESFFLGGQPFQDLDFLAQFKSVIVHSLCKNGYIDFENRTINQVGAYEYWKCIGDHIVSIVQIASDSLSIQYKDRNEPEKIKFVTKKLDLSKIEGFQDAIEEMIEKKSPLEKTKDDVSEFMEIVEQLTPEQLNLVLERARAFAELNKKQEKKD